MSLPLIKNIKGRSIDRVIDENGNAVSCHVFGFLIKEIAHKEKLDSVKQIKFIQRARKELIADTITDFLTSEIHGILGPSFQIRFEFPDQIPVEESGKFQYFISELSLDNHNT
jgi:regulatory protein YycH of two-component signal transduction system YycFG